MVVMLPSVLISVSFGVLIVAAWHWWFLRFNKRRALRVLRWLEGAIASHGQISGVEWVTPSHFRARLRLVGSAFRQPSLDAQLAPRQMPVKWATWRWNHQRETLTFEANLTCPPRHSMEIGRTRWTGLARRWMRNTSDWPTQTVASLFISTQAEWEPEISSRMTTVVSTRELEFLGVSFRPRAPHFSVTFSLEDTLKYPSGELTIFESLRELAEGSPTSRM
jgi:hypothetical protein